MPIRPVKRVIDTSAKGQNFKKEDELYERFMVGVSLISLKTIGKHDLVNRTNEFYFKADGGKAVKSRTPDIGTINLRENQVFEARSDQFTIWSEFAQFRQNEEKVVNVTVELREQDVGRDDRLGKEQLTIKCPQKTDYMILQDKKGETKAKLKIYAKETRY